MTTRRPAGFGSRIRSARFDEARATVVLTRLDGSLVEVPVVAFTPSGDGTTADAADLVVIDYGQTLRLGRYEASVEGLLQEFAPPT